MAEHTHVEQRTVPTVSPAPSLTGGSVPARAATILAIQRSAGNSTATAMLGRRPPTQVQRDVTTPSAYEEMLQQTRLDLRPTAEEAKPKTANVPPAQQIAEVRANLLRELQSPEGKEGALFQKWLATAKKKWLEADKSGSLPSDEDFFSSWQRAAMLMAKDGGALDKIASTPEFALKEQGSALAGGSFWSTDATRFAMGSTEYQGILQDTESLADTFAPLFVSELEALPKGAKVGFWSGGGADDVVKTNCAVSLEKSTLARAFDWNAVTTWSGGREVIIWAALSKRYATEIAKQWDKLDIHGFIAPGADAGTIYNEIESKSVMKVLGEEVGMQALSRVRWHGVKKAGRAVDWTAESEGMKGCFVSGKKKLVEFAVQGMR